jgi:tetratricopeptide (TPR) repeat protein
VELDPLSLIVLADIGQLHYFAHEYDQARDYCNRALALDGEFYPAHEYLVDIFLMKGMEGESLNETLRVDFGGLNSKAAESVKDVYARGRMRAVWANQIDGRIRENAGDQTLNALVVGRLYCRLGDKEDALTWPERAMKGPRHFWHPYLAVDPLYDNLRDDSRFKEILRQMNLP